MRLLALPVVLASLATLACAKPAVEQGSTGSSGDPLGQGHGPDGPDDGPDDSGPSSSFASAEPRPVDAPQPGSCPASKIREVRYGGTVDKRTELPAKISALRCVDDLYTKLEADIACAQAFNEASWGHALYESCDPGCGAMMEPTPIFVAPSSPLRRPARGRAGRPDRRARVPGDLDLEPLRREPELLLRPLSC